MKLLLREKTFFDEGARKLPRKIIDGNIIWLIESNFAMLSWIWWVYFDVSSEVWSGNDVEVQRWLVCWCWKFNNILEGKLDLTKHNCFNPRVAKFLIPLFVSVISVAGCNAWFSKREINADTERASQLLAMRNIFLVENNEIFFVHFLYF